MQSRMPVIKSTPCRVQVYFALFIQESCFALTRSQSSSRSECALVAAVGGAATSATFAGGRWKLLEAGSARRGCPQWASARSATRTFSSSSLSSAEGSMRWLSQQVGRLPHQIPVLSSHLQWLVVLIPIIRVRRRRVLEVLNGTRLSPHRVLCKWSANNRELL